MRNLKVDSRWRERTLENLLTSKISGATQHSREKNLQAIYGLSQGDPFYTFGIKGVQNFPQGEILKSIASVTKCSPDIHKKTGSGYISPEATLEGLIEAAQEIGRSIGKKRSIFLGTGHPGGLLFFYQEIAKLIQENGGDIITPSWGVKINSLRIDYLKGVAVLSDGCSIIHTHDFAPMEVILEKGRKIDLVLADHGFAGAAVNHNLPVIAIIDTNDPALAMAKKLQKNLILVPMDDNALSLCYQPVIKILKELFG